MFVLIDDGSVSFWLASRKNNLFIYLALLKCHLNGSIVPIKDGERVVSNQFWLGYNSHNIRLIRGSCWEKLIVPFQLDTDICQLTVRLAETASGESAL